MPAPERLGVGPVRERNLDLHEDVPRLRLGLRNLLDPDVARAVVEEGPHGVKTTFSASWER